MRIEADKYVLCPKEKKLTEIIQCDGCEFCKDYDYQYDLSIECNFKKEKEPTGRELTEKMVNEVLKK